jgi:twinkle protein
MGIKSSELKFFNRKVKGLRTGELTIFSGGTGSGKTTLLSQMSLDFCKKGVPTLWGSFEIQNEILVSAMMSQFSDTNLTKHPEKLEHNFAKFAELPLYYMSFFGSTDLEKVFSTIEYAIEKYQISHIIIDTLQFLLADQATGF